MAHFIHILLHYLIEILPALAIGFFISGLVHEFVSEDMAVKYLGSGKFKPVLWATLVGTVLPVCCWGSLPIAISFYKKGAKLGPIFAFLVATPATSISALLVTWTVLGPGFAIYTFFAVVIMGIAIGLIGNAIKHTPKKTASKEDACPHCQAGEEAPHLHGRHWRKAFSGRLSSILRYAYIELPSEIGWEILIGIILAAFVAVFVPIGNFIRLYLGGALGYIFAVTFGIITYLCATAGIPLVDSLINQGLGRGAGMALLLIGPVTSYGTILVLGKEYGIKVLSIFLASLIVLSVLLGFGYQLLAG